MSRNKAGKIAAQVLKTKKQPQPVKLYGLPKPLKRGAAAYEGRPGKHRVKKLKRKAFFYWEDLAPGALFSHPGVMLLIDARSGKVVQRTKTQGIPYINGKEAPFLLSDAAYNSRKYVVVPVKAKKGKRTGRPSIATASAYATPINRESALKNDCLVEIGDWKDPLFAGGHTAMNKFADGVGLKKYEVTQADFEHLKQTVATAVADGCKDVFLYIAGHGTPPETYYSYGEKIDAGSKAGPPGVNVNPNVDLQGDKSVDHSDYITPQNLIDLVNQYTGSFGIGGVDFKIKIDSCFSGRFEDVFRKTTNVAAFEAGAAADETGYNISREPADAEYPVADPVTHLRTKQKMVNNIDNPDGATTFTNANVHGLMEWGATAPPEQTLLAAVTRSMSLGDGFDFAENVNYTHPLKLIRGPVPFCQTVLGNQGTPNEVISNTGCDGTTYNELVFTPQNGNTIINFFPESGQASCNLMGGSLFCSFPSQVITSGPIDIRFGSPPNATNPNLQIKFSSNAGATFGEPWFSSGP